MDRDLVLAGLVIISVGFTLLSAAPLPRPVRPKANAREWERATWRALWWPSIPVVAVVSVLVGWALVEPAISDEPLSFSALMVSSVFSVVWMRAVLRATRALAPKKPIAGTIGVWRPEVIWSDAFVRTLDPEALDAARLHEAAHVEHRDPRRIWLAQFITDLEWPWPSAHRRFARWRHVLELARDEEARLAGADGADLAAAILAAAQLQMAPPSGATLLEGSTGLQERVNRLLAPIPPTQARTTRASTLVVVLICAAGVLSGMHFGETFVQALVRWL